MRERMQRRGKVSAIWAPHGIKGVERAACVILTIGKRKLILTESEWIELTQAVAKAMQGDKV